MKNTIKPVKKETANVIELVVSIKVRKEASPNLFRLLKEFDSEAAHLIISYVGDCLIDLDTDPYASKALREVLQERKYVC